MSTSQCLTMLHNTLPYLATQNAEIHTILMAGLYQIGGWHYWRHCGPVVSLGDTRASGKTLQRGSHSPIDRVFGKWLAWGRTGLGLTQGGTGVLPGMRCVDPATGRSFGVRPVPAYGVQVRSQVIFPWRTGGRLLPTGPPTPPTSCPCPPGRPAPPGLA